MQVLVTASVEESRSDTVTYNPALARVTLNSRVESHVTQVAQSNDAALEQEAAILRRRILQLDDEAHQITTSPASPASPLRRKPTGAFSPLAWATTLGLGSVCCDALLEGKPSGIDDLAYLRTLQEANVRQMFEPGSLPFERLTANVWRGLCDLQAGNLPAAATTPKELTLARAKRAKMLRDAESEARAIVAVAEARARLVAHDAAAKAKKMADNSKEASKGVGVGDAKWKSLRLRLKVQSAFKSTLAAHERRYAVDEADFERPGQAVLQAPPGDGAPQRVVAQRILGPTKISLQKLLTPLVLQLRVARAFRSADDEPRVVEGGAAGVGSVAADEVSSPALPAPLVNELAVEVAKWALRCAMQPPDKPTPELLEPLRQVLQNVANGNGDASTEDFAAADTLLREMSEWGMVASLAELQAAANSAATRGGNGLGAAIGLQAGLYVRAVTQVKADVIDVCDAPFRLLLPGLCYACQLLMRQLLPFVPTPHAQGNVRDISSHLEGMWSSLMDEGQKEIEEAGMKRRTTLKFRAQHIHRTLTAAMDNVASQLRGGMEGQLVGGGGAGSTLPPRCPKHTIRELCDVAIVAFRSGFDRPWQLDAIEAELERRCHLPPELESAQKAVDEATKTKAASASLVQHSAAAAAGRVTPMRSTDEPAVALLGLLVGSKVLPLDEEVSSFLRTAVAEHLDPFIDGHAQPTDRQQLLAHTFMERLDERWAAREAQLSRAPMPPGQRVHTPRPSPISTDAAYAAYAAHAISKMNATFGFALETIHGVGRPPVSSYEQMHHLMQLGTSLLSALERDFPDEGDEPTRATMADMTLKDKARAVAEQLGIDVTIPLAELVSQATSQLGLDAATDGKSLVEKLDACIAEAVQSNPTHALGAAWRALSAEEITFVAQAHLAAMHRYHSNLAMALTAANEEGEVNRQQERWTLFRIPVPGSDEIE